MSPFRLQEEADGESLRLVCRVSCFLDRIGLVSGQISLRRVQ